VILVQFRGIRDTRTLRKGPGLLIIYTLIHSIGHSMSKQKGKYQERLGGDA